MTPPANPVSPPRYGPYIDGLLTILGSRDPIQVLRATPALLHSAIAGVPSAGLRIPEAPGKWSMVAVLQHLADSELVGGFRFRMVLAHDRPDIPAYDQDRWAGRLHYDDADAAQALDQFTVLRRANLNLFECATPQERERVGIHSERGPESLGFMIRIYAGHDLVHLRQLDRIRKAIAAA